MCTVGRVAAVHRADEAGASAVAHVAVHHRAPGAPQRAVPVAVAGRRRALEAGVPQGQVRGPRLAAAEVVLRLGRPHRPGSEACGEGEGVGQRGSLLGQDADDTEGRIYKTNCVGEE